MGRPEFQPADNAMSLKFYLQRCPLTDGYDSGGAYWGNGEPLYWACSVEETMTSCWVPGRDEVSHVESYLRAYDREDAKAKIRSEYQNAKFFN
jgi:hypothetical protein